MSGLEIEVSVTPEFRDAESNDSESRYVFSYTVTVHNQSPHSVQLMARYWKITQGSGDSQEVRGKGVVGQQPLIGPGQRFRYTSRAILQTPVGVMEGAYTLLNTYTQRAFDVPIAPFRLAVPRQLH
ncbi:Co2+/Mg2+ efflux protein ApaG [Halomonas sp. CnH100-B]|uniref:Co2+/Mg2+ efflux protein ApaG n=1 Tax=Halomonadaceae TaxID=28256 RepID=UPI000E7DA88E|nr:Co2+/Mg2+ efflux protein ApaG [Halomonas meridiana]MCO7229181.1 Co2+/Mg2+ efflux protein ApaG [Halomonas sp. CnH100-B]MDP4556832.1 Co2+/Mg2+ efflux protein ApaG [Halomonas meridiana]HBM28535.1 Co2+/Mg2+ efflux protein ApaG [Halomonas sp.]